MIRNNLKEFLEFFKDKDNVKKEKARGLKQLGEKQTKVQQLKISDPKLIQNQINKVLKPSNLNIVNKPVENSLIENSFSLFHKNNLKLINKNLQNDDSYSLDLTGILENEIEYNKNAVSIKKLEDKENYPRINKINQKFENSHNVDIVTGSNNVTCRKKKKAIESDQKSETKTKLVNFENSNFKLDFEKNIILKNQEVENKDDYHLAEFNNDDEYPLNVNHNDVNDFFDGESKKLEAIKEYPPPQHNNNVNINQNNNNDKYEFFEGDFVDKIEEKSYILANLNDWKSIDPEIDEQIENANLRCFGFRSFRPNQREIINASLMKKDIFVCMPTGGGKSLTFQIPGMIEEGVTIIVMPLLSLIQDQISFLEGIGVKAIFLKGDGITEIERNFKSLFLDEESEEKCKFIFVTPEKFSQSQLTKRLFRNLYELQKIERFIIDEAHCLSQWGREFRPDYLNLKHLRSEYPNVPISAITATATDIIRDDIIKQLRLRDCLFFRSSYNRSNLFLEVRNKKTVGDPISNMVEFINKNYKDKTGIIYCSSRKDCENVCKKLYELNLSVNYYHASMTDEKRKKIQEMWKNNETKIIVATIAFGMGINKNDVRFVIHYNMPKSFENYYQEIGRAGRDGNHSHCILYYQNSDRKIMEFLLTTQKLGKNMIEQNLRKINEIQEFCEETAECRRSLALLYFGEKFRSENCGKMCDNCQKGLNKTEKDMTDQAHKVCTLVNFIKNSGEKMTLSMLSDYCRGVGFSKFKKLRLSHNNFFGILKEFSQSEITKLLRRMVILKILSETMHLNGKFIICYIIIDLIGIQFLRSKDLKIMISFPFNKDKLNNFSHQIDDVENENLDEYKFDENELNEIGPVIGTAKKEKKQKKPRKGKKVENIADVIDYGYCAESSIFEKVLENLKEKRIEIVKEINENSSKMYEINQIFPDNGLLELCRKLPENNNELQNIFGVGDKQRSLYGSKFIDCIINAIKEFGIDKNHKEAKSYFENEKQKVDLHSSNKKRKSGLSQSEYINSQNEKFRNEISIHEYMNDPSPENHHSNVEVISNIFSEKSFNYEEEQHQILEKEEIDTAQIDKMKELNNNVKRNKKKKRSDKSSLNMDEEDEVGGKKKKEPNYFQKRAIWNKINAGKKKKK